MDDIVWPVGVGCPDAGARLGVAAYNAIYPSSGKQERMRSTSWRRAAAPPPHCMSPQSIQAFTFTYNGCRIEQFRPNDSIN